MGAAALKWAAMPNLHKVQVQDRANQLYTLVTALPRPPAGHAALAEQLRQAVTTVRANVALAVTHADPPQLYGVARASAVQCAAHIDCYRFLRAIAPHQYEAAMALLSPLVAALTKLAR